jgi:hypothetical protein
MKTALFLLCLLFTAAAFGQAAVAGSALNAQPQVFQFASHTEHASRRPMGHEQNLLEMSVYTYARGERPLWEVAPALDAKPLGDTARELRTEHASAKKAAVVWEN